MNSSSRTAKHRCRRSAARSSPTARGPPKATWPRRRPASADRHCGSPAAPRKQARRPSRLPATTIDCGGNPARHELAVGVDAVAHRRRKHVFRRQPVGGGKRRRFGGVGQLGDQSAMGFGRARDVSAAVKYRISRIRRRRIRTHPLALDRRARRIRTPRRAGPRRSDPTNRSTAGAVRRCRCWHRPRWALETLPNLRKKLLCQLGMTVGLPRKSAPDYRRAGKGVQ